MARPRPASSGPTSTVAPSAVGGRGELGAQPALADAGLAGDHGEHRAAPPTARAARRARRAGRRGRRAATRTAVCSDRWRCAAAGVGRRGGPLEGRVLAEHGGLQRAQLGTRLETELVGEQLAHLPQHLERVGLPSRAGQGQGAQAPEPLAQRVRRGQHLELAGHHRVPTEPERRDGPVLERDRAQLLEPGPLGLRGRCVLELGVGQPAPQREPVVERARTAPRARSAARSAVMPVPSRWCTAADRRLEAGGVEGVLGQDQRVAGLLGDQHLRRRARWPVGLERAAQPGDVPLQGGGDGGRWRLAPEQVDERVLADRLAAAHREGGQQRPLLARAEVDRGPVDPGLGGSQDADAHVRRIGVRRSPGRRTCRVAMSRRLDGSADQQALEVVEGPAGVALPHPLQGRHREGTDATTGVDASSAR